MPKGTRGGRRSVVGSSNNTAPQTNTQPQNNVTTQAARIQPQVMQTTATPNYQAIDDNYVALLREMADDYYEPSVVDAIKQYISKNATSSGYSMSQDLNYKLEQGLPLNANEKYMVHYLTKGMHDIGQDTILYRGAHQDVIQALGIKNYDRMSEKQLQSALIGAEWTGKSFQSTSYDYNKSPFLAGSQAGGREVVMKIKAPSTTGVVLGAKSQAEIVLGIGTRYRITGVKYTGKTASPRNSSRSYKQIELEVEIY